MYAAGQAGHTRRSVVKYGDKAHNAEVRGQRSEVEWVTGEILASRSGDGLLARIFTELTRREREVLWAFLVQPDDHELAYLLKIQPQTVRNHLAEIESKLLIDRRPALASRVLLALWQESRTLANS